MKQQHLQSPAPAARPAARPNALALAAVLLLAAACSGTPGGPSPAAATGLATAAQPASAAAPTPGVPTAAPTLTATPAPAQMQMCLAAEPDTLYPFSAYPGRAPHLAAAHVRQALFDGPIDPVGFAYRPVLVQDLPTLENGGAQIETVTVHTGERYYDAAADRVTEWREGETALQRLVMTYTLQPGVLWSDGEPLTADDSVFAFELLAGSGADPAMEPAELPRLAQRTAAYEALDERTVRWTGLPGYLERQPLVTFDTFFSPMPRHQLGGRDPSRLKDDPAAARQPLGWGPFVLEEWRPGEAILLRRNPAYYRASEGLPRLESLVFRFVPDAAEALRLAASGEAGCAVVLHDSFGLRQAGLLPQVDAAVSAGTLQAQFQAEAAWEHLDFNLTPAGDRAPFFADPAVRQAVALCLDREGLANAVYPNHGAAAYSLVPQANPYFWPEAAAQYPYDPAAGRAALAGAGWAVGGGAGEPPAQKDGLPLAVELALPEGPAAQTVAGRITQNLAECGFRVSARFAAQAEFSGAGALSPIIQGDYDLAQFAWRGGPGGEPQCRLYVTAETPTEETGWLGANVSGYGNPEYDAACADALRAGPLAAAQAAHEQAQRLLLRDLPALPLFQRVQWLVAQPAVTGLGVEGIAADELRSELIDVELLGYGG